MTSAADPQKKPESLPGQAPYLAAILTGLVAMGPVSTDLYLPSLPSMRVDLMASAGQAQLTLSAFVFGIAIAQLVHGPLSDRFGRRPVLIGGLLLYIAASLFCALASSIEALIAGRVLQALGACVGPVVGRAIVRDVYGREDAGRVMSYIATAMAVAPAIGPMIGGVLEVVFGWRSSFAAMLLYGGFALTLVVAVLKESNRWKDPNATRPGRLLANYRALLSNRIFISYCGINAASFAGLFAFISGASFVIIEVLEIDPAYFGFCFLVFVLGFMSGAFFSGKASRRLGGDRLILIGTLLTCLSGLAGALLAFSGVLQLWAILAPIFPFMVGMGMVLPNAFASAIGPFPRMAGSASALLGFLQMMTAALSGVLVGQLADGTAQAMWAVMFLSGAAALAVRLWLLPKEEVRREAERQADLQQRSGGL